MNEKRLEWRVGLFIFIGLGLMMALFIYFSKSTWRPGYTLQLISDSAEGVKVNAQVLLAGVQIGRVSQVKLAPDGKSVTIALRIYKSERIYRDAQFKIEQAGFLGDHYIAVHPTRNEGGVLGEGSVTTAKPPFDLYGAADAVLGFLKEAKGAVAEIRTNLLNEQNLTRVSSVISNADIISSDGVATVRSLYSLIESNRSRVSGSLSNLDYAAGEVSGIADGVSNFIASAKQFLETNGPSLSRSLKNLESSTGKLDSILEEVKAGQGPVGELISDRGLAISMAHSVTNISVVTSNLSVTASNLNRLGLWGILWKHNPPRTNDVGRERHLKSPKDSFN